VQLEVTVAKKLTMKDFLSRFNGKGEKAKPATENIKVADKPEAKAEQAHTALLALETSIPPKIKPSEPTKPSLAKAPLIELDNFSPPPRRSTKKSLPKISEAPKPAAKARNADLAKIIEVKAQEKKEKYEEGKRRVLASRRKAEKEDDRLGSKKPAKTDEAKPVVDAEAAVEDPVEEQKQEGDLDSGDEDVVLGGIPEHLRPKKRKLARRKKSDDEDEDDKAVGTESQAEQESLPPSPRLAPRFNPPKQSFQQPPVFNDSLLDIDGEPQPTMASRVLASGFQPPIESDSLWGGEQDLSSFPALPDMDSDEEEDSGLDQSVGGLSELDFFVDPFHSISHTSYRTR
jgi:hypothetical protein